MRYPQLDPTYLKVEATSAVTDHELIGLLQVAANMDVTPGCKEIMIRAAHRINELTCELRQ